MKRSIIIVLFVLIGTIMSNAQDISSALRQAQARFDSGNETGGIEDRKSTRLNSSHA